LVQITILQRVDNQINFEKRTKTKMSNTMENILNIQSEEIKKLKNELEKDQDLIRILNTLKAEQETLTAMSDEKNRKTHLV
jgi:hypothetical protein